MRERRKINTKGKSYIFFFKKKRESIELTRGSEDGSRKGRRTGNAGKTDDSS